jgi:hypothetical protein
MAKVKITGAKVERIIQGYGFAATEPFTLANGEPAKAWFTVWTDAQVKEGEIVDVTGDLSVKLDEYTGSDNVPKTRASANINNAKVESAEAPF